ncbi:hypothetical protein ACFTZK_19045 [Streptomyces decoyicus]|uniref:hypothetical protein n=1 Tax=Streptomyces decoyicus TaxID=249567 RepID=UPI00362F0333
MSAAPSQEKRRGTGPEPGHHGELRQGVLTMLGSRPDRGLTRLPCRLSASETTVELANLAAELTVTPDRKTHALRAVLLTASARGFLRSEGCSQWRAASR